MIKPLLLGVVFLVGTLPTVVGASGELSLSGVLKTGGGPRFVLTTVEGRSSGFLALGSMFSGAKLTAYNDKTGELTVEREGKALILTLPDATVTKEAPGAGASASMLSEGERILEEMGFDQMIDKTLQAQQDSMTKMMRQAVGRSLPPGVSAEEFNAFQARMMTEVMGAMNTPELRKDLAKVYAETFTLEELRAMSAFHATEVGRSIMDKNPRVQEKFAPLMMQRLQTVMPRIQAMSREFIEQAKARQSPTAPAAQPTSPVPAQPKS